MFDGGQDGGCGTELAVQVEWVASFVNAPPVIFPAPHKVRRFPKVLAVIARPDLPRLVVNRHAPWIAQAVGPDLRSRVFKTNKGVVPRHRVSPGTVRMIGIDAEHSAE